MREFRPQLATCRARLSITGTATMNARFPGQWFQPVTCDPTRSCAAQQGAKQEPAGLHYNWHRSYDPAIGRYTQPDPLGFVDGPSVYGYVVGSPAMLVDSEGLTSRGGPSRPVWALPTLRYERPLDFRQWSRFQRNPDGTISNRPIPEPPNPNVCPVPAQRRPDLDSLAMRIIDWLGPNARRHDSPSGAPQWMSHDNSRLIRFDISPRSAGRQPPHINMEPGGKHIYLK